MNFFNDLILILDFVFCWHRVSCSPVWHQTLASQSQLWTPHPTAFDLQVLGLWKHTRNFNFFASSSVQFLAVCYIFKMLIYYYTAVCKHCLSVQMPPLHPSLFSWQQEALPFEITISLFFSFLSGGWIVILPQKSNAQKYQSVSNGRILLASTLCRSWIHFEWILHILQDSWI